jgi:hypothetical protein
MNPSQSITVARVAAARPKALPMANGQTIGKLRLPLPPDDDTERVMRSRIVHASE